MLYKIFLEFCVESENAIIYRMYHLKNCKFCSQHVCGPPWYIQQLFFLMVQDKPFNSCSCNYLKFFSISNNKASRRKTLYRVSQRQSKAHYLICFSNYQTTLNTKVLRCSGAQFKFIFCIYRVIQNKGSFKCKLFF